MMREKCMICQSKPKCNKLRKLGYLGFEDGFCLLNQGWGFGVKLTFETSKKAEEAIETVAA